MSKIGQGRLWSEIIPREMPLSYGMLYHARWEIELANDEIKTHLLTKDRPTHLRSRTPKGVIQEFYGVVIAYNAIRCLVHQAALRVDIDPPA